MTGDTSTTANENGSFSGLDAVEKVRNLDQALIATTCQAQAELQNAVLSAPDNTIRESRLMQQAIEGKDPVAFKQLRKIAAVCLMTMGLENPLDYVSASMFADRGIFSVRTDFAVGSGECNETDAVERLIDRGAAQLKTWLEVTVPRLVDAGLTAISTYVVAHCPAAAPGVAKVAPVVRSLCQMAVIPAIRKGAEKIQAVAKSWWQKLKNKSNSAFVKIVNTATNFLAAD